MFNHTTLISTFSKQGIEVKSATENIDDSPSGKFAQNMIAAVAQFDNDMRSHRTRDGMKEAVLAGSVRLYAK